MDKQIIYTNLLDKQQLRSTKQRNKIFEIFAQASHPLSAVEVASLSAESADTATTYRTIDTFLKAEILRRVSAGWKDAYELSEHFVPHHHHFTCLHCGKITSFGEPVELIQSLRHLAESQCGANMHNHSIELSGLCKSCSQTYKTLK
ncbi:MAG: Fur family transcriptional regulator, partial [Cumulibacter sp.]